MSSKVVVFIFIAISGVFSSAKIDYTPIVLWHGMGDSCCFPFSMGSIKNQLNESMPGVYVLSLRIGDSVIEDVENGYLMHPDKQVELACNIINNDTQLLNGYNAIGFSQGSQFLRAVAQRCDGPLMRNLISVGGQHQGVYGLPNCGSLSHTTCDYIRKLLNFAAYESWVQEHLVQATYWHDPLHEEKYIAGSTFLADINNEKSINETYIKNLSQLENFVMIKFDNDTMVEPVDSEWFGFYKPGQSVEVERLQESRIYTEDRLGLQDMDLNGQLHFLEVEGNHLQFEWSWFEENVINKFLV